jgi:hypothetical protein
VASAAATTTTKPMDLPESILNCPQGKSTPLRPHVTYHATEFPIAIRLTPPNSTWLGAQWKTGSFGCHATNAVTGHPPYFGWVALDQGPTTAPPQGVIEIMTAYGRTPSVAAAINALRTRGHGATYGATSAIKLAGFSGSQFDGQVVGKLHIFFPFTPQSQSATYHPDAQTFNQGDLFRIIALNVRGKTVVVELNRAGLPAAQFPAFLARTQQILKSLRFPG